MSGPRLRVAGAPITWGVCEVDGWGYQMPYERVLREAAAVGIRAIELGPPGFLPEEPAAVRRLLGDHGLRLVAGFLAVVLHRPERWEAVAAAVEEAAATLSAAGAGLLVLGADTGETGYERSVELSEDEWRTLARGADRAAAIAARQGLLTVLHPHYGTVVERPDQIERVLESTDLPLCLDTGHLLLGGSDPTELVREASSRVAHVHLKDIDGGLAARVRRGEIGYRAAVAQGLYRPLGAGDLAVGEVVGLLESSGYRGWYVLEQDAVLEGEPADGEGPLHAAIQSLKFLTGVMSA